MAPSAGSVAGQSAGLPPPLPPLPLVPPVPPLPPLPFPAVPPAPSAPPPPLSPPQPEIRNQPRTIANASLEDMGPPRQSQSQQQRKSAGAQKPWTPGDGC